MRTGSTAGTIAVLTGSTLALAMIVRPVATRADELQVNQQSLNNRIDQLAAGQFVGPSVPGSLDTNPVAEAQVTAGSYPRSILIPGTDTSIKVYGIIRETTDYWMSGGPPNGSPQSTNIGATGQLEAVPLGGTVARARSNGIFQSSPKESLIGFETRTPTPLGEARTLMEFDWAASNGFVPGGAVTQVSDSLAPRLKYGYGTLGGLLAGQATSNFSDPDANAETLDFGGPAGFPGKVRVPQIRYTMPAWWGGSFSVSAETPETTAATSAGAIASDSGASTVTGPVTVTCPGVAVGATATCTTVGGNAGFALNPFKAWGHFDVSAVMLPGLDVADGKFVSRSFIGYGGHVGADVKPGWLGWTKDDFTAQFEVGQGLGSYVNANSSVMLQTNYPTAVAPATLAAASTVLIHPVTEISGTLGYQHWWLGNLNSTIAEGIEGINISPTVVGATTSLNRELMTTHANLLWYPIPSVLVGLEYMWGQRTAVTNAHATENTLISKFRFDF
jgi:hypothetical protein